MYFWTERHNRTARNELFFNVNETQPIVCLTYINQDFERFDVRFFGVIQFADDVSTGVLFAYASAMDEGKGKRTEGWRRNSREQKEVV